MPQRRSGVEWDFRLVAFSCWSFLWVGAAFGPNRAACRPGRLMAEWAEIALRIPGRDGTGRGGTQRYPAVRGWSHSAERQGSPWSSTPRWWLHRAEAPCPPRPASPDRPIPAPPRPEGPAKPVAGRGRSLPSTRQASQARRSGVARSSVPTPRRPAKPRAAPRPGRAVPWDPRTAVRRAEPRQQRRHRRHTYRPPSPRAPQRPATPRHTQAPLPTLPRTGRTPRPHRMRAARRENTKTPPPAGDRKNVRTRVRFAQGPFLVHR